MVAFDVAPADLFINMICDLWSPHYFELLQSSPVIMDLRRSHTPDKETGQRERQITAAVHKQVCVRKINVCNTIFRLQKMQSCFPVRSIFISRLFRTNRKTILWRCHNHVLAFYLRNAFLGWFHNQTIATAHCDFAFHHTAQQRPSSTVFCCFVCTNWYVFNEIYIHTNLLLAIISSVKMGVFFFTLSSLFILHCISAPCLPLCCFSFFAVWLPPIGDIVPALTNCYNFMHCLSIRPQITFSSAIYKKKSRLYEYFNTYICFFLLTRCVQLCTS